jgi:hypothetical protein
MPSPGLGPGAGDPGSAVGEIHLALEAGELATHH